MWVRRTVRRGSTVKTVKSRTNYTVSLPVGAKVGPHPRRELGRGHIQPGGNTGGWPKVPSREVDHCIAKIGSSSSLRSQRRTCFWSQWREESDSCILRQRRLSEGRNRTNRGLRGCRSDSQNCDIQPGAEHLWRHVKLEMLRVW